MSQFTRRAVIAGAALSIAGCTSTGDAATDDPTPTPTESGDLESVFRSAAENTDRPIVLGTVDVIDEGVWLDFWSDATTMDERAQEMGTVCGIYAGVVSARGDEVPPMLAFGIDPDAEEDLYSFRVERSWAEQWLAEEIDGSEVVERAADTYEEYVPPGG